MLSAELAARGRFFLVRPMTEFLNCIDGVSHLMRNLPSLICFGSAMFLAVKKVEGWGWFLFVGFLLFHLPGISN